MSSIKKVRIQWVDVARGIAILFVILGHAIFDVKLNYNSYAAHIIFAFHMPIFFIVSGYFYREKKALVEIRGGVTNLIFPYMMTAVLAFIAVLAGIIWVHNPIMYSSMTISKFFVAVLYGFGGGPAHAAGLPAIGATWFLLAMFVAMQIFNYVMRLSNKQPDIVRLMIFTVLAMIGLAINDYVFLPWSTNSALLVQPFLFTGYMLKKYDLVSNLKWPVLVSALALWLYAAHVGFLQLASATMPLYLQQFIGAVSATLVVFWVSQKIERYSVKLTKILSIYGSRSIVVFCFHALDLSFLAFMGDIDRSVYPLVKNQYLFLAIVFIYRLSIPTIMMLLMPYLRGLRSFYLNRSFPFNFQKR